MKLIVTILLATFVILTGCRKERMQLKGKYKEVTPVANRSQLHFSGDDRVIKSEPGSNYQDIFSYQILNGKIRLTSRGSSQPWSGEFHFRIIDNNTFEIGNLYPTLGPSAIQSFMTFRK